MKSPELIGKAGLLNKKSHIYNGFRRNKHPMLNKNDLSQKSFLTYDIEPFLKKYEHYDFPLLNFVLKDT